VEDVLRKSCRREGLNPLPNNAPPVSVFFFGTGKNHPPLSKEKITVMSNNREENKVPL